MMARGYLIFVLHAHLPYVRHPEHATPFEELWLFEAITESYIPLIRVLEGFRHDRIPCRITLSLSPTLMTMLQDRLLQQRYLRHLQRLCSLARAEIRRFRFDPERRRLARMYLRLFTDTLVAFRETYRKNILAAFKKLQDHGLLEIITTAATHAFLPLLKVHPSAVRAQIMTGAEYFRYLFGVAAPGMWLPECGYYPGLERVVQQAGFRYFFLETHGLVHADPAPRYGPWAPVACAENVAAFCRDMVASRQIWSSTEGYPGDPVYREFYCDIAHERDPDYLARYLPPRGEAVQTGIKYYCVTGHEHKELYDPERARLRAQEHAKHFVACRIEDSMRESSAMDRPPAITVPFDAELFGHWWFEGPWFLDAVVREVSKHHGILEMVTPSDYLKRHPDLQKTYPAGSSWGYLGYNEVWLNQTNDWLYPHLHAACAQMEELAQKKTRTGSLTDRARRQAARSLLLAQASDWPFIMRTGTTVAYARARIRDHLARFHYLARSITACSLDERTLKAIELLDAIFPTITVRHFQPITHNRNTYEKQN